MPKITTHRHGGYEVTINYRTGSPQDKGKGHFWLRLPTELLAYEYHKGEIRADSEDSLRELFAEIVVKFKKDGAKRDRILLVQVEAVADRWLRMNPEELREGVAQLKIKYHVLDRVIINDKEEFYTVSRPDSGRTHLGAQRTFQNESTKSYHVIPWTEEREKYVDGVVKMLNETGVRVRDFFADEGLALKLDAAPRLLTLPEAP